MYDAKNQYRTRFGLQAFAGNYKNYKKFALSSWLCRCQEAREDESHRTSDGGATTIVGANCIPSGCDKPVQGWHPVD